MDNILDLSHSPYCHGRPPELPDACTTNPMVERAWRERLIREAAYFRAQQRQPCLGHELDDWLGAEKEIDAYLDGQTG